MTLDFVDESFIPLYEQFQIDFAIEISNASNRKMIHDFVNEYSIPSYGKFWTYFAIVISNSFNTKYDLTFS